MALLRSWNGEGWFASWSEYTPEAATVGVRRESKSSNTGKKEAKEAWILELCLNAPLDCWTVIVADGEDGDIEPAGAVWVLAAPFGCIPEVDDGEGKDAALWLVRALDGPADFSEVLATAVVGALVDADFGRLDMVDVRVVEHCEFEDVTKGRTLVPFTTKETSAQSSMLRRFTA